MISSNRYRKEHLSGYQERDRQVVDYKMYELGDTGLSFRGPSIPLAKDAYFTCLGAAQTFGCLCDRPYPDILAERLGLPTLNLGYGGAGPEFFARRLDLLEYVNRGRFAVIQVMSGRSQSNSVFSNGGLELQTRRSDGVKLGANAAYQSILDGPAAVRRFLPGIFGKAAARAIATARVRRIVNETRRAWVASYLLLLSHIEVPVVLLWLSERSPLYRPSYRSLNRLFGKFPQLIDSATLEAIKSLPESYVECVSARGMPQLLTCRETGEPIEIDPAMDRRDLAAKRWTHNHYYPSPEMHADAAQTLLPACASLIQ